MRTRYNLYSEYHTSGDNLEFISSANINEVLNVYLKVLDEIENRTYYKNLLPFGEPQLGKRNLYFQQSNFSNDNNIHNAIIWLLSMGDGTHSLEDVSNKSGIDIKHIKDASLLLMNQDVIKIYE